MTEIEFFPLDLTYKEVDGHPCIYIYGKTPGGQKVCIVEKSYIPYFYIHTNNKNILEQKLKGIEINGKNPIIKIEQIEKKLASTNESETFLKVYTNIADNIKNIRNKIYEWEEVEDMYEYDIPVVSKYLKDKQISPLTLIYAKGEPRQGKISHIIANKIEPVSNEILNPKVLAINLEIISNKEPSWHEDPIIMISLSGREFRRIITWKRFSTEENVEYVKSEADLIQRFLTIINEYQPDFITGWNSDYQLDYLKKRAEKYFIKTKIGLDNSEIKIQGMKNIKARIIGIPHIDLYKIKKLNPTDTNTIEEVAYRMFQKPLPRNRSLLIAIQKVETKKYCQSMLEYTHTIHNIFMQLFPKISELTKIVSINIHTLFRMSTYEIVETFLMQNTDYIPPNHPDYDEILKRPQIENIRETYSKPGIYSNISQINLFNKSSLIPIHNICISTLNCDCCINSSEYWYCKNKKGFLPKIMDETISRILRIKTIKEANTQLKARLEMLKFITTRIPYYLNYPKARWYCNKCYQTIQKHEKEHIQSIKNILEKHNHNVIYIDEEKILVEGNAQNIIEEINTHEDDLVELEFVSTYEKGVILQANTSHGLRHKYFLKNNEDILIHGYEYQRKHWCNLAKKLNKDIAKILMANENGGIFLKKIIDGLKQGKIKIKDLIIFDEYHKEEKRNMQTVAAEKMMYYGFPLQEGRIVEYLIHKQEGILNSKVKLINEINPEDIDINYYLKYQILPAVEDILKLYNYHPSDYLDDEQKTLSRF